MLELLQKLFAEVIVPSAVSAELSKPAARFAALDIAPFPFLKIRSPLDQSLVKALLANLQAGEAEAIALAEELHADLLLLDDLAARLEAARRGFEVTGVFGILLRGKTRGFVTAVMPLMDQLQAEVNFYIDPKTRMDFLKKSGE